MTYMTATVAPSYYFKKKIGMAMGISKSGCPLGGMVYPFICYYLEANFGWKNSYLCLGIFSLICVVCGSFLKPLRIPSVRDHRKNGNIMPPTSDQSVIPNPVVLETEIVVDKPRRNPQFSRVATMTCNCQAINNKAFVLICIREFLGYIVADYVYYFMIGFVAKGKK